MLHRASPQIHINKAISFIGINASGKTSTLKVISFEVIFATKAETVNKLITVIGKDKLFDGEEFFMTNSVNRNAATIIFSTHYPELLDEFKRNDSIYIVRNEDGINAENLSAILKRNDIKKSEVYQSGYLQGTVPAYEAYMDLRKAIMNFGGEL